MVFFWNGWLRNWLAWGRRRLKGERFALPRRTRLNPNYLEERITPSIESSFRGGLTVAVGDLTGDGIPDFVSAPGTNEAPRVVVFGGTDGQPVSSFLTHEESFLGGVFVATGDLDGDGFPEVVAGAGESGGSRITVTDPRSGEMIASFFAYEPTFSGGVRVAVADIDGDGRSEIITGPGFGGGPHVRIFDRTGQNLGLDFMAYEESFRGGVAIASADTNGDGNAEIVTAAGLGGGPHIRIFNATTHSVLQSFYAFDSADRGGAWVASADVDGNGLADVVVGSGSGRSSRVRVFAGAGTVFAEWDVYEPSFLGGVRVAAADINGDGFADVLTGPGDGGGPRITIWDGFRFERDRDFFAASDGQPLGFGLQSPPERTPLFDGFAVAVPGIAGQAVTLSSTLLRRLSNLPGEVGLFRIDDREGRIESRLPNDSDYANSALAFDRRIRLFTPTASPGTETSLELPSGQFYGMYLVRGGSYEEWLNDPNADRRTFEVVFPFPATNPDGVTQFRKGPRNRGAFEDAVEPDDDFNDLILDIRLADEASDVNRGPTIIGNPNQNPVAVDDRVTTGIDTPVFIDPLSNDTDADGQSLTLASVGLPGKGTIRFVDGLIEYTPSQGFTGLDTFSYSVNDGFGGTSKATVTITVSGSSQVPPSNRPPVANDDSAMTAFETSILMDVLANDTDPDGDPLAVVLTTGPSHGIARPIGTKIEYIPNPDFVGTDRLQYQASDGRGGTSSATVTISVMSRLSDFTSWTVSERGGSAGVRGSALLTTSSAVLREGDSFVTSLSKSFIVPEIASTISFIYDVPVFDRSSAGFMNDAFEAVLIDSDGHPLVSPFSTSRDAFFNESEGLPVANGNDITVRGGTVSIDLSDVPAGTVATLVFRMVNNDADTGSAVTVTGYSLPTDDPTDAQVKFFVVDAGTNQASRYGVEGLAAGAFPLSMTDPRGVASNPAGDRVWVVDATTDQITIFDVDGNAIGSWTATDAGDPQGITVHNGNLWLVDLESHRVLRYDGGAVRIASSVASSFAFALVPDNSSPSDLVTDGATVWVTDEALKSVFVYDVSGTPLGRWTLDADNVTPSGITRNPAGGTDLWVLDRNTKRVFQYAVGTDLRSGSAGADGTFDLNRGTVLPEGIADPPVTDPEDQRDWQKATVGTFARLYYGEDTPTTRQQIIESGLLDDGLFPMRYAFPARLLDDGPQYETGGISLDEVGTGSYDYVITGTPITAGSAIDNLWFQSSAKVGQTVFELPFPSTDAAIFPVVDHGPLPQETIESTAYLSNDRIHWQQAVVKKIWLEGWKENLGVKWDGFVYAVGTDTGETFRYVSIIHGGPAALIDDNDDEINGVVGLSPDLTPAIPNPPIVSVNTIPLPAHPDSEVVLSGSALADLLMFADGMRVQNRVVAVTVNDVPVDALDSAGNFFSIVRIRQGENEFRFVATDEYGQTGEATLLISSTTSGSVVTTQFVDLSATFKAEYARTSYDTDTRSLIAQVAVRNLGSFPASAPLYVGVRNISDPSVRALNPSGVFEDGTPYYEFAGPLSNGAFRLDPSAVTGQIDISFSVPNRKQFTYDLVFLGVPNRPPAISSVPPFEAHPGKNFDYLIDANDPDGDIVHFSLVTGPDGMVIDPMTGHVTWGPSIDQLGSFDVTIRADDDRGGVTDQKFTLVSTEAPPNRPPVFTTMPNDEATVGGEYRYDADANDPDGDMLTYSLSQDSPSDMEIDPSTGAVTWSPNNTQIGDAAVTLVVNDGRGGVSKQTFYVCVNSIGNRPPIIVSKPVLDVRTSTELQSTNLLRNGGFEESGSFGSFIQVNPGQKNILGWEVDISNVHASGTVFQAAEGINSIDLDGDFFSPGAIYQDINTTIGSRYRVTFSMAGNPIGPEEWPKIKPMRLSANGQETIFEFDTTGHTLTEMGWERREWEFVATAPSTRLMFQSLMPRSQAGFGPTVDDIAVFEYTAHFDRYEYDVESLDPDGFIPTYSLVEAPSGMTIDERSGAILLIPDNTTNLVRNLDFSSGQIDFTTTLHYSPSNGWNEGTYTIANSPYPWHPWAADFGDHTSGSGPMMVINGSNTPNALIWQQDVEVRANINYEFSFWARSWTSESPGKLQLAVNGIPVGAELTLPTDTNRWVRYSGLWKSENTTTATISIRNAESAFFGNDFAIDDIGFAEVFVANQQVPVSVRVEDGRGGVGEQSFVIIVSDSEPPTLPPINIPNFTTNSAPVWVSNELPITKANSEYLFGLSVDDPDNDPITFSLVSAPDGLLAHPTLGVLAWYPLRNQVGTHQVVVVAKDDHDNATVKAFEITVVEPNTAPIVISSPPSGSATVGLPFVYQVFAQDAEQDEMNYSLVDPIAGMLIGSNGLFSWTPTANDVGTQAVKVRVTDGAGGVTDHDFMILIASSPLNTSPFAKLEARNTAWLGHEFVGRVVATDSDGDLLTYTLIAAPPGLTIDSNGFIRWMPGSISASPFPLEFKVSDGRGGETTLSTQITVAVTGSNVAPTVTSVPSTVAVADSLYSYDLSARDDDGDLVTWELVTGPQGMSLDSVRGTLRWIPEHDQTGPFVITIRAYDAYGASTEQFFTLWVSCVNQPPRISSVPVTVANANFVYAYAVRAVDPDNEPLTFTLDQAPAGIAFLPGTNIIRWVPTTSQVGPQSVTIRVTDQAGNFTTQDYTVIVEATAPNRSPVVTSQARAFATLGKPYEYLVTASDPDGDSLTFQLIASPDGMSVDGVTGLLNWPNPLAGKSTVSVAVTDGRGGRGIQTFTLTARVNQAPSLAAVPNLSVTAGASFHYGLTASDPDGDVITYRLVQAPVGMTVDDFGRVVWQTSGTPRTESVTVAAIDAGGLSATRTFVLTLTPDNQAPRVSLFVNPNVVNLGQTVTVQLAATDNVAVNTRSLNVIQGGITTPLALTPQGLATFTPLRAGRYTFVAIAKDMAGNEGRASAELRAIDPNDTEGPEVSFTRLVELLPNNQTRSFDPAAVTATVGSLTDVFATIHDNNGGLDDWVIRVARADQVDYRNIDIDAPVWRTIATGSGEVADGKVATFDPTILTNDRYVIAIAAYDVSGRGTVRGIEIDVSGGVKLGEFTLSFTDLSLPLNGIPIEVTRVFDSRESATSGDFGYGWRLGLRDARIRETVPAGLGSGLFSNGQPFRTGTKIYLDLPDGRRAGFTFTPEFGGGGFFFSYSNPKFVTDPGFEGFRLEVDATQISQRADGSWGTPIFGIDYNPNDYRLITPDGLTYSYNQQAGLQKIRDLNGNEVTFTPNGITHSGGRGISFIRDGQGRITEIIDVAGKSIRYSYDASGDLRTFADQMTATTKFTYNLARAHYLDTITDPSGRQTVKTEYDASGRVVAITDANGSRVVQEFDPLNFRETIRDARGNPTILTYNERGNVTRKETPTDFGPVVEQFFYEDPANPDKETKVINPRGFATTRSFDARGNLLNETTADGTTKYTYNAANKLTSVVDTLGRTTAYDYSAQGNLVRVVNPLGDDSLFTYDSLGRVASYEDFNGNTTMFLDYCSCGRPRTIQNPDGSIRTLETNAFSQITKVTDEIGNVTQNFYDDAGRLIRVVDGVGAETKYEYQTGTANVVKIIDPLGNATEYKYDGANNKTQIIDSEGGVTIFGYDNANNLVSVTDPVNNVTKFIYDQANRLKEEVDPLGKSRFYTLDAAGNKIAILDRNNKTRTFTYDALNRNTLENWLAADGSTVHVIASTYDKAGNLLTANDPDAKLSYTYDALNRVKTATTEYPGTSVPVTTLTYGYDANGNRKSVVDNFGVRVDSVYSDRNELLSRTMQGGGVSAARVEFEYADNGERKLLERFSDATGTNLVGSTSYAYFANGLSKTITHKNAAGGTLVNYDYLYDLAGRLKSEVHHGDTYQYGYDKTGQLLTVNKGGSLFESFTYDKNGNRKTSTGPNGNQAYAPAGTGNRLMNDGQNNYTYDGEGNLKSKTVASTGEVTEYTWDHRNRLVNAKHRSAGGIVLAETRFGFDAVGRRVFEENNGAILYFTNDGIQVWSDANTNGVTIAHYLFSGRVDDILLRWRINEGTSWYLNDKLGTIRDLAGGTGEITNSIGYNAYGKILFQSNPGISDRYAFTGRESAGVAGQFQRARFYDTVQGRFVSQDPLGITILESNLYRYVGNFPTGGTDPSGLVSLAENTVIRTIATFSGGAAGATLSFFPLIAVIFDCKQKGIQLSAAEIEDLRLYANGLGFAVGALLAGSAVVAIDTSVRAAAIALLEGGALTFIEALFNRLPRSC
jgi:choice-of-anchor C domain-containing protein